MALMSVWPTDAGSGAVTSEARWRAMARNWSPHGIVPNVGLELAPSIAAGTITVRAGACWVDGHYCDLSSDQNLTATANGIVVVRFDPTANTAELLYRDGVSVPTQSLTGVWELVIARVVASVLVDVRPVISTAGAFCSVESTGDFAVPINETVVPFNGNGFRDQSGDLVRVGTTSGGVSIVRGGLFLIQVQLLIGMATGGSLGLAVRLYRQATQIATLAQILDANWTSTKFQIPYSITQAWACKPGDRIEVWASRTAPSATIFAGGRSLIIVSRVGAGSEMIAS